MTPEEIYNQLKTVFGDRILEFCGDVLDPYIKVAPDAVAEIASCLRNHEDLSLDSLMCLSGADYPPDRMMVVYHLYSMIHRHRIVIKVELPRDNPHLPTVENVWGGANWHEREAYDLFGILFDNHSDLRRILLPDDWEGYPLRKDYQVPEYYRGIKVEVPHKEEKRMENGK